MKRHLGELNTIFGAFLGGRVSSAGRKRYTRSVMHLAVEKVCMPSLTFMKEDLRDVFPHDNDPIVISVIMKCQRVHRVLVDQGSLADVLFWDSFVALGGSL